MKGDFTRDTFDPAKHFSRVLMQQGRVTLDADSNEQAAILLYYLRTLARDLMGPYAAPAGAEGGFLLTSATSDGFTISKGRYYVDGILVENAAECTYSTQPDYSPPTDDALLAAMKQSGEKKFWLYLDVWERHITPIEDDTIREKALGGADTCTRTKVVWQVKAWVSETQAPALGGGTAAKQLTKLQETRKKLEQQAKKATGEKLDKIKKEIDAIDAQIAKYDESAAGAVGDPTSCADLLNRLQRTDKPNLAARVDPGAQDQGVCVISPDAKYRGAENQLYRVEIHQGGSVGVATFKWSRDNGSIATAWLGNAGGEFELEVANARGFAAGNWVELSDDTLDLREEPGVLVKLAKVEGNVLSVDPDSLPASASLAWSEYPLKPKVRRWDQIQTEDVVLYQGAVPVQESLSPPGEPVWIDLEDGVQIQFASGGRYRSGDYWLIPARVATGNIEWPGHEPLADGTVTPRALPPHGVEHHYAPLDFVTWTDGKMQVTNQCRCDISPPCPRLP
jgi:hypothetical protein